MGKSPHAIGVLAAVVIIAACAAEGPLVPARSDPFVYLVVNQLALQHSGNIGTRQRALLTTVGSPTSSNYLVADAVEMRRVSDSALFRWLDQGNRDAVPKGLGLHHGNYALPDTAVGASLGALAIAAGDTFDLTIQLGSTVIRGGVRVPAAFAISEELRGSARVVTWPRVPGAASYSVEVSGRTSPRFQSDTLFVLPVLSSAGAKVYVKAMDRNLTRFVNELATASSGIDNAFGVFGAIRTESLFVAPASLKLATPAVRP